MNFNVFRLRIVKERPDEHSQLVFQPVQLILASKAFVASKISGLVPCDNTRIDRFGHRLIDLFDFELFYVILCVKQGESLVVDERGHTVCEFIE